MQQLQLEPFGLSPRDEDDRSVEASAELTPSPSAGAGQQQQPRHTPPRHSTTPNCQSIFGASASVLHQAFDPLGIIKQPDSASTQLLLNLSRKPITTTTTSASSTCTSPASSPAQHNNKLMGVDFDLQSGKHHQTQPLTIEDLERQQSPRKYQTAASGLPAYLVHHHPNQHRYPGLSSMVTLEPGGTGTTIDVSSALTNLSSTASVSVSRKSRGGLSAVSRRGRGGRALGGRGGGNNRNSIIVSSEPNSFNGSYDETNNSQLLNRTYSLSYYSNNNSQSNQFGLLGSPTSESSPSQQQQSIQQAALQRSYSCSGLPLFGSPPQQSPNLVINQGGTNHSSGSQLTSPHHSPMASVATASPASTNSILYDLSSKHSPVGGGLVLDPTGGSVLAGSVANFLFAHKRSYSEQELNLVASAPAISATGSAAILEHSSEEDDDEDEVSAAAIALHQHHRGSAALGGVTGASLKESIQQQQQHRRANNSPIVVTSVISTPSSHSVSSQSSSPSHSTALSSAAAAVAAATASLFGSPAPASAAPAATVAPAGASATVLAGGVSATGVSHGEPSPSITAAASAASFGTNLYSAPPPHQLHQLESAYHHLHQQQSDPSVGDLSLAVDKRNMTSSSGGSTSCGAGASASATCVPLVSCSW